KGVPATDSATTVEGVAEKLSGAAVVKCEPENPEVAQPTEAFTQLLTKIEDQGRQINALQQSNAKRTAVNAARVASVDVPKRRETRSCFNCSKFGHLKRDCRAPGGGKYKRRRNGNNGNNKHKGQNNKRNNDNRDSNRQRDGDRQDDRPKGSKKRNGDDSRDN